MKGEENEVSNLQEERQEKIALDLAKKERESGTYKGGNNKALDMDLRITLGKSNISLIYSES